MADLGDRTQQVRQFFVGVLKDQIHLTVIQNREVVSRDFAQDYESALDWAEKQNRKGFGVYYSVNRVREGLNKKAAKNDITQIRFAHVDMDPPKGVAGWSDDERMEALKRLETVTLPPTAIINSGNGWQALWRLDGEVSKEDVEDLNNRLISALGGDKGTQNADRILRVPGLTNWPNKQKIAWGRREVIASTQTVDPTRFYDLEEIRNTLPKTTLPQPAKPRSKQVVNSKKIPRLTADDLGLGEDSFLRSLIEAPKNLDRSSDTYRFACEALKLGLTKKQIMGILLNPRNSISAHCLDQTDPVRAARRSVENAQREPDVKPYLREVEREGERRLAAGETDPLTDKTRLWTLEEMLAECVFIEDGSQVACTSRPGQLLSKADFVASAAASSQLKQTTDADGQVRSRRVPVSKLWLEHPGRRTVATTTFKPGCEEITHSPSGQLALNSWVGFRQMDPPKDWRKRATVFESHVRWLWGSEADAFLDWLAHILQKPGELPSYGWLHIARQHGMGRNWISTILGRVMIGYTALAFDLAGTLRSGFNGSLAGKVLAIVDEIDEGNSQRKYIVQQTIKQFVTEETRTINPKYGRQHEEWNACRWLIFSNSGAALPLEEGDRRFWVVDCDDYPKDAAYYSHLYTVRNDPSFIAAVAQFLMRRDISGLNIGARPPITKAKAELLERTRSDDEQTLRKIVQRWPVDVVTNEELQEQLGYDGLKGAALRHALDRAGIVKLREWKNPTSMGVRRRVIAYAVRNAHDWRDADLTAVRREIGRINQVTKELIFDEDDAQDLL